MDDSLDEVLSEFVVESQEHLENIEAEMLQIEADGGDLDLDLINRVFRAVHSIKGASGFLGLETIGELSHSLENILDLIRKAELVPDSAVVNAMLTAADRLNELLNDVSNSNDADIADEMQRLQAVRDAGPMPPPADDVATASTPEPATSGPESSAAAQGAPPAPKASPAAKASERATPAAKADAAVRPDSSIRVPVSLLDSLMNLAGELVLSRNQLLQTMVDPAGDGAATVTTRLDQVVSELQGAVMQTRMQPIGNVFGKFPRVVRDLCAKLGKEADLILEGKDVDLDKSVIEAINDPLTHLIRNSVDHGLELPEDRERAGKSPRGTIKLRAFHMGGKVNVEISDDGAGINPEKLQAAAIGKGLITEAEAAGMTHRETLELIFRPGFSTAAAVTDVSGRGVGMDVVRTNLENLGGTVEIESQLGVGTTLTIKIPLTLAIMAAVVVSAGGQRYAVPQSNIRELVRVRASEVKDRIAHARGCEVLRQRGRLLPLVRLESYLKNPDGWRVDSDQPPEESTTILIVESGAFHYGICVDSKLDAEEIVVKPLDKFLGGCHEFSGATILGDGAVAMILDINGIATSLALRGDGDDERKPTQAMSGPAQPFVRVVLFRNQDAERFAVPLGMVTRIERIMAEQLQRVGNSLVYECRGRALPLVTMSQLIQAEALPESTRYFVLVVTLSGREVGILVPELDDIRGLDVDPDPDTLSGPGVCGSFQMNGESIRILDISAAVATVFPHWFADNDPPAATNRKLRILFAEDSKFFRNKLVRDLSDELLSIEAFPDGAEAWQHLDEQPDQFDLVLTDLEMPNLDGLGLTRRIKADPRTSHLPVIALTSLASEEDVAKGRAAGVDEYQVKLDKQSLVAAIQRVVEVEA